MLEKIQERALRFVYDDFESAYEGLLNKANVQFLYIKQLRTMAFETFRILNNMSPSVLFDLVRVRESSAYNFRYQNILQVPQVRTTAAVPWNIFQIILDKKQF